MITHLEPASSRARKQRAIALASAGYAFAIAVLLALHLTHTETISRPQWVLIFATTIYTQGVLWLVARHGWDARIPWDRHFVYLPMGVAAILLNLYTYAAPTMSSVLLMSWFIVLLFAVGLIGAVGVVTMSALMAVGRILINVLLLQQATAVSVQVEMITFVVYLLVSVYVGVVFERLRRERDERRVLLHDRDQAGAALSSRVSELEQRTREIALLNRMMQLFQGCATVEEAYGIAREFLPQLLPADAGQLSVLTPSRTIVEDKASWGASCSEKIFAPEDCWALRLSRAHPVADADPAPQCQHLSAASAHSLCVPLVAQGEVAGVLTLARDPAERGSNRVDLRSETTRQFAITVADHIALSLANLRLRESLRLQSIRDPLTGLFNRRYLEETLERELRRVTRKDRPLGVIMIDLDHFKQFNDLFGHQAGDALLRELGMFVQTQIRVEDIACRYGGEEFVLILPEASLDVTRARAEQLRERVRHLQVQHRGRPLGAITLSCGVAAHPEHGDGSEILLRAADSALYQAKSDGRDCVVVAEQPSVPSGSGSEAK